MKRDRENYHLSRAAEWKLNRDDSLQVSLQDTVESIMMPYEQTRPLRGDLQLKTVMMRFFKDDFVPIIDNGGACVGIVHAKDCVEVRAAFCLLAFRLQENPNILHFLNCGRKR